MTHDEKELSRFYPGLPSKGQEKTLIASRQAFLELAEIILQIVPSSTDRSSAMRYLRLAHMQVNSAICHDWVGDEENNG